MPIEPVEIEFLLKNVNSVQVTEQMKKDVAGVGETTQRTAERVSASLNNQASNYSRASSGASQFAKTNNQLSFSIQQVARELPNAAISSQIFFMAISNNLPILADNLKRAREEYAMMKAAGQQTTPVWKQVASSIFSWQTLLVAGITLMTVYGGKIGQWLSSIFKATTAINIMKQAQEKLNEVTLKGKQNAQEEITKLQILYSAATDSSKALLERNKAVDELQKIYPSYLGNISNEVIMTGKAAGAYENLKNKIIESAKARAYSDQIAENSKKILQEEEDLFKNQVELEKASARLQSSRNYKPSSFSSNPLGGTRADLGAAESEFNKFSQAVKKSQDNIAQLAYENKKLSENINVSDFLFNSKNTDAGIKKTSDELAKAKENLDKAVIDGDKQQMKFQAAKIVMLEKEKQLREWTAYLEIQKAKGYITNADANLADRPTLISQLSKSSITQKGNLDTNAKGQLIEITAVDKTGPTLKKMGLETDKLNKKVKEGAKDAADVKKKLDEEESKRKERLQDDLLNYSRQFTSELIDQLGLTQDQNRELQSLADTIYNLAKGDYLAAGFSAASMLMTSIFSSGKEDSTTKALENVNNLLERQSAILANISGSNYFDLAQKQYNDLGTAISLNNDKLKQSYILSSDAFNLWTQAQQGGAKIDLLQFLKQNNLSAINTDSWTPQDFIDAYTNGTIALDKQQTEWVQSIVELQKQRAELLQETFRQTLGFDASNVSDSILQGIENGLELAADNSLGGFAKTFGELVKESLVKNITDALNIKLTEGFLADFNKYMSDNTLTDVERAALESEFAAAVADSNARWEAIKPILDKYGVTTSSNSATTGIAASATEDTVAAMVGQLMAMRVDMKDMVKMAAQGQDDVAEQLKYMKQIAENTAPISRLKAIEEGIVEMNRTLKEKL